MEKQTGVFHLLYGVRLYWPGEAGLKNRPRRKTIYKLNGSGRGGIVEFFFLSLFLSFRFFIIVIYYYDYRISKVRISAGI